MKVAKKVFFIVLMIWALLAVKAVAQTATTKVTAVLREGASTSTEPVGEVKDGETVEIIEKSDNWYKVNYNGQTGYIREDLLNIQEEQTKKEEETQEQQKANNEQKQYEEKSQQNENTETNEQKQQESKTDVNPLGKKIVVADIIGRIVPSLSASKLEKISAGTKVTVIKVLNAWSLIKYSENNTVWIPTKLLKDIEEEKASEVQPDTEPEPSTWTGYINVSAAIIRSGPSTSSEIITEKYRNNAVEVIGEEGDWYRILVEGKEAYIAKRLISTTITAESASRNLSERNQIEQQTPSSEEYIQKAQETIANEGTTNVSNNSDAATASSEEAMEIQKTETIEEPKVQVAQEQEQKVVEAVPVSLRGDEVVATAKKYLGCSYVYGGSGPSSFDCSGFTMYVYGKFGVSLAHGAISQSNAGTYVSKNNLQPGDLVIFRDWDNTSIGHCGIYIGGGKFIHAANPKRGVVTDTLNSGYYYERYVSGRRLV